MSYEQHIKHWRNHRKDKAYQQCSGYFGDGVSEHVRSYDKEERISEESFKEILQKANEYEYPIYVSQYSYGNWSIVPCNHMFGTKINSVEELERFASDYVFTKNEDL